MDTSIGWPIYGRIALASSMAPGPGLNEQAASRFDGCGVSSNPQTVWLHVPVPGGAHWWDEAMRKPERMWSRRFGKIKNQRCSCHRWWEQSRSGAGGGIRTRTGGVLSAVSLPLEYAGSLAHHVW
jgi:hypothetical protein